MRELFKRLCNKGKIVATVLSFVVMVAVMIMVTVCTPPVVDDDGTPADTTAPTVAIVSPVSNISINSNTYNIEGTASDAVGVENIYIKIDGGVFVSLGALTSWSTNTSLSEGASTILVYADDAAGNVSTTNSVVITVNMGRPVIIFTEPATSPHTTNVASIDIGGTADVSGALGIVTITGIEIKTNGGAYATITNGGSNVVAWSTNAYALAEGTNTITVQAISDNGKTNDDSIIVIYDTTPPTVPVVSGDADSMNKTPTWTWSSDADAVKYRYSFVDGSGWTETNATNFTPTTNLAVGATNTLYVQAADIWDNWSTSGSNTIVVMPRFTEINPTDLTGVRFSSIDLGDIDGDTDLDLILTGYDGSGNVSKIYTNNGSGGFGEINPTDLIGVSDGSIDLGDIDGDTDLDLILTGKNSGGSPVSKIYQNDDSGSFTEDTSSPLTDVCNSSTMLGDIDGDTDLDLILTGYTGVSYVSNIYTNNSSGGFGETNSSLTGVYYSSIDLGDIDGDGTNDLILTGLDSGSSRVSKIYTNNGSGGFTEINIGNLTGVAQSSVKLGDIDGDTDLDLILTGSTNASGDSVSMIYRNNGTGAFTEINPGTLAGVRSSSIDLGDIDGDGDLDLILTGWTGSSEISKIYTNNGSGGFSEDTSCSLTGVWQSSIKLGDIDGDGDLDMILTGRDNSGSARVSKIYRNNTIN